MVIVVITMTMMMAMTTAMTMRSMDNSDEYGSEDAQVVMVVHNGWTILANIFYWGN